MITGLAVDLVTLGGRLGADLPKCGAVVNSPTKVGQHHSRLLSSSARRGACCQSRSTLMTRLKGTAGGISWLRLILILLALVALVLGLDYIDVIPLHFW